MHGSLLLSVGSRRRGRVGAIQRRLELPRDVTYPDSTRTRPISFRHALRLPKVGDHGIGPWAVMVHRSTTNIDNLASLRLKPP
jgi:hypothetical protein